MSGKWDMKTQLAVGAKGEKLLLKHWSEPVQKHPVFKGPDFVDVQDQVIELKTDTYDMEKTPNFFIERWSDFQNKKPGGPWQASEKGVHIFVYLFIQNKTWFIFRDMPALLKRLEELTDKAYAINIPNRGWTTQGYRVKRADLQDLFTEEKLK
jgi:hypothetical protein